jgi:response regulator RpfG family c-di-GMP phosphodiesterase
MRKILFVDDDPNILDGFKRQLFRHFDVETAPGGAEALVLLEHPEEYAVVVADMRMPEMSGVEFLAKARVCAPDVVRLMLTGNADQGTAIEAINSGSIFRFLNKPCPTEKLVETLKSSVRQHQLLVAERNLLETTLNASICVLSEILSVTDPKSFGQSQILREKMRQLAGYLELDPVWIYEAAASLSQIGQVTIPREVLLKMRVGHTLTAKEQDMVRRIPYAGSNLIAQIPRLDDVCKIIQYQAKRFDGLGFPDDSLAGDEIPLGSRMMKALSDLISVESEGIMPKEALEQLRHRKGWYDPDLLEAIAACFKIQAPPIGQDGKPSIPVTFAGLRVSHMLVSDLVTKDNVLIVSKGNKITPALLMRLRNFSALSGIREPIYVEHSA